MKMNKFFAAALAATALFASCAKEEQPVNGGEGEGATIQVAVTGTAVDSRVLLGAAGHDIANVGTNIWDATVFVLDENDAVITKKYYSNANLSQALDPGVKTTTAAVNVIVVANTGSDMTASKFANVPTLTELKKVMFDLSEAVAFQAVTNENKTDASNRVLLQGQTTADLSFSNGVATTEVLVFPVPARLDVTVLNRMHKNGTPASGSIWSEGYVAFESVAVLYSAAKTYAVPTVSGVETGDNVYKNYNYTAAVASPYVTPYYTSGFDPAATDEWGILIDGDNNNQNAVATTAKDLLYRVWTPTTGAGTGDVYAAGFDFEGTFYALPAVTNAGTKVIYPTITVIGTYDQDPTDDGLGANAPQRRFWHIKMSPTDAKQLMESGRVYDLTIKLQGDILNGGGGVKDPDDEVVPADVVLTITPKGWQATTPIVKPIE